MFQPKIIELPALTVIGFEGAFIHALSPEANNLQVIGGLWNQLCKQQREIPNQIAGDDNMYGVIYGRAEDERSHPDELQYIACVEVTSTDTLPDGMSTRTVPAALFAVFEHDGKVAKIGETCKVIFRDWLPKSDYEHAGIADVEVYGKQFNPESDDSVMEYRISIQPKSST